MPQIVDVFVRQHCELILQPPSAPELKNFRRLCSTASLSTLKTSEILTRNPEADQQSWEASARNLPGGPAPEMYLLGD